MILTLLLIPLSSAHQCRKNLLHAQFGDAYDAYCFYKWRLIPRLYEKNFGHAKPDFLRVRGPCQQCGNWALGSTRSGSCFILASSRNLPQQNM